MSLGEIGVERESKGSRLWLKQHRGIQFALAATGGLISWRLSSPRWIQLPAAPGPASFGERFLIAGLPLLGLGLCVLFISWGAILFNRYIDSSEPRMAAGSVPMSVTKRRLPLNFRLSIPGAFTAAVTLEWGEAYVRYLWPSHTTGILKTAAFAQIFVLGVALVGAARGRGGWVQQLRSGGVAEREPWVNRRQVLFIVTSVVGLAILFGIDRFAKIYFPSHLQFVMKAGSFLLSAILVGVFIVPARNPEASTPRLDTESAGASGRNLSQRRLRPSDVAAWVTGSLMVAMLLLPLRSNVKTALFLAPLVLLLAIGAVFSQVKRQVLKLKAQGDFDGALRLDKRFSWIPGYGTSLEGVILFSAGRYHEAQALMKPLAFDRNGQPKLRSMELYIYTLALINDGRAADAQELLDAAVRVPQRAGNFHVSLATCLLSQNKDEERARELLEQAMSNWPEASGRYEARADLMRRIARYAWALAACGRREDAKAKLQESFAGADGFRDGDMAGLHYFAGETWRVLGDTSKSRAAFKEAMKLSPTGSAGMSAKKGLAKLADL